MQTLYKDYLLDHYRYPRNVDVLSYANCASEQHNPSCGDSVFMTGNITSGILQDLCFTAQGCVICVAGASLLGDYIKGLTVEEIRAFDTAAMIALIGISLGPTRLKCALLPLYALQGAVKGYAQGTVS